MGGTWDEMRDIPWFLRSSPHVSLPLLQDFGLQTSNSFPQLLIFTTCTAQLLTRRVIITSWRYTTPTEGTTAFPTDGHDGVRCHLDTGSLAQAYERWQGRCSRHIEQPPASAEQISLEFPTPFDSSNNAKKIEPSSPDGE